MKRCGLDLITLATVLFTAFTIAQAGWFATSRAAAPRQAEMQSAAKPYDPLKSDAAMRYRRCQVNHWRACILQH